MDSEVQWYKDLWFRGERRAQTRQKMRGIWIVKKETNTRLEVKYSYYAILILDTAQLIVNNPKCMESYGTCWKLTESPTSLYVILKWSGVYVMSGVRGLP